MFILANFIHGIAAVLNLFLTVYLWLVVIRAVISWVNPDPFNPIVQFLTRVTDPALRPIRRRLSMYTMSIDLSPLVLAAIILFLQIFLVASLDQIAVRLGGLGAGG
ncbi:MAG TPA: YggT family protein [Nitrospiria bacterium]